MAGCSIYSGEKFSKKILQDKSRKDLTKDENILVTNIYFDNTIDKELQLFNFC